MCDEVVHVLFLYPEEMEWDYKILGRSQPDLWTSGAIKFFETEIERGQFIGKGIENKEG